jgi:hypothetical protein
MRVLLPIVFALHCYLPLSESIHLRRAHDHSTVPSLSDLRPPTLESAVEKETRLDLRQREGSKRSMTLSTGTTVTLWAPDNLTPNDLSEAAKTVNHLAKTISDCFCTFRALRPDPTDDGYTSTIEPHAETSCVCNARAGLSENVPDLLPTDFYGTTLEQGTTAQSLLRYDVPTGASFTIQTNGLVLSLDAGDRRSYDARDPSVWTNVAGNDDDGGDGNVGGAQTQTVGHLHGFIGFNSDEGGGSLKLGAHGNRDFIVCKGLDISAPSMQKVTIEMVSIFIYERY